MATFREIFPFGVVMESARAPAEQERSIAECGKRGLNTTLRDGVLYADPGVEALLFKYSFWGVNFKF